MKALYGVLHAVALGRAFDAGETIGEVHHAAAELIDGLRLFAARDIDLGRRLVHGAAAFGLAALGGFEPAGHAAQLLFDAAESIAAFALAPRDMREHVFRVAPRRAAFRYGRVSGCVGGPVIASRCHVVIASVGEAAQNASGHPFADRQTFPSGGCSRSFTARSSRRRSC